MKKKTRPNGFIYFIFRILTKFLAKFKYNTKCLTNELNKSKGGIVVIANHGAWFDFVNLAAFSKRRINFVISKAFYETNKIKGLIDKIKVIPKQQFQTTSVDMKRMKRVVDEGGVLSIYPAGLMTEFGAAIDIPRATARFLKWLDKPIYLAHSDGSYLTMPKWSKITRKGRVEIKITELLSQSKLQSLDETTLEQVINKALDFNDYKWQEKNKIVFKNGSNIEGLENVLYICPNCHQEYTIESFNESTLKCSNCHFVANVDKYGLFCNNSEESIFRYPTDWYEMEKSLETKKILSDKTYCLSALVDLYKLDSKNKEYIFINSTTLELNKEGYSFYVDNVLKKVSIANVICTPFTPGEYLEIQDGVDIYRCVFHDGKFVQKWIFALRTFYKMKSKL